MNHYETLNLAIPGPRASPPSQAEVKAAYRAALLLHHPDKAALVSGNLPTPPAETASSPRNANERVTTKSTVDIAVQVPIDAIRAAYAVLSNPTARREYDRTLALLSSANGDGLGPGSRGRGDGAHRTGNELLDLDDFTASTSPSDHVGDDAEEEGQTVWHRPCRCGDPRGYEITEAMLEAAVGRGEAEIAVGCAGCSLWVAVGFGVADEEEGEEGE